MVGHDLKVGHQMCPHLSSHSCILTMYMYLGKPSANSLHLS